MYPLARPFLFGLDAETAHGLGLKALDLAYRAQLQTKKQAYSARRAA